MSLPELLERVRAYHPNPDLELIRRAYGFARARHEGQLRVSGEPYIAHPVEVALIVAQLKLDESSIAAALLHDTVEDTPATIDEVRSAFGEGIANIVDGLTTLSSVHFRSKKVSQAENFRKMLVAMARDIRVLLVKLADRVHNMRTVDALPAETQTKLARETLEIYAPLANRLGIAWIKTELEDQAFRHLHAEEYAELLDLVEMKQDEREQYTQMVEKKIRAALDERGFQSAEVRGRAKHFFSIYRKMRRQGIEFDKVFDLIAFRVIVDTISQCYEVLGVVHTIWRPIPGRFKDYIALPKPNGYQSLHTAVIGPYGEKLEVQIRTREMHRVAEQGIAAHWRYKEGRSAQSLTDRDEQNFAWLKQLVEWQQELRDPSEFIDTVKVDLFPEEVYVFTPGGDLKVLPRGATPVDFAYEVHTEVGHRCTGAKVNGGMVKLQTELKNGDRVEILTHTTGKPNRDWLKFVKSSRARNKIRAWLRQEERDMSRDIGRSLLERELRRYGRSFEKLVKSGDLGRAVREFKCQTVEDLCVVVGYNKVKPEQVAAIVLTPEDRGVGSEPDAKAIIEARLTESPHIQPEKRSAKSAVTISGIDDMLVRYAKCCRPVPGDEVVGFVTRGRGLTVHLRSCPVAQAQPPERLLQVSWEESGGQEYEVRIRISTVDKKGILTSLTDVITRHGVNITQAVCRSDTDGRATNTFSLSVNDTSQLGGVMRSLERLQGVLEVERLRS
jgi:GTP pyrophosphokinase